MDDSKSRVPELISDLLDRWASLLLYQNILEHPVIQKFSRLLTSLTGKRQGCLGAYNAWFRELAIAGKSWEDILLLQILHDDNPFSRRVQSMDWDRLPPPLIAAARQDLRSLQALSEGDRHLHLWVQEAAELTEPPIAWQISSTVISPFATDKPWADCLPELARYYQENGVGIFAQYRGFRWESLQLRGVSYPDSIQLEELVGYDRQKQALLQNTEALLAGHRALNILLYGSRGSGKSSLVKGLSDRYANLRLIEVSKSELKHLPKIVEEVRNVPQKFIIFVDDLSFEEDDDAFKSLKVVLEGNITAKPDNTVVYATSNRRHLIREFFSDRPRPKDAEEIHNWDTVQEKLSFSDRFGLTLTFEPANQNTYLEIVRHLAARENLEIAPEDLEYQALQWATRHNGRSGRTARQFIDWLVSSRLG
ncbi:ATP-binding protein [Roseofilum casamattae]|uniref:ATP-binding protein n=1 Tax=Roseofilum casamattae BLCC-M143 TaxID=3022442 RepID=A0ABT7BWC9_9CYAN|nr:ATP-binding protein [Roseofilum casamattae]MDJ1183508.1 ATP-binding protein [Roseofilum casamattae BLCC-M143]